MPAESSSGNGNVGISSLKDGSYNEAESHNGFLDALNAWRNAGKEPEKKEKVVKFEETPFVNPADREEFRVSKTDI